jgi:hypothetical protein
MYREYIFKIDLPSKRRSVDSDEVFGLLVASPDLPGAA